MTDNILRREMIVLDPDDHKVIRFLHLHGAGYGSSDEIARLMQAQIRPPRIPEPGLWAVVKATTIGDQDRRTFLRTRLFSFYTWVDISSGAEYPWGDLLDPTLTREGVKDDAAVNDVR